MLRELAFSAPRVVSMLDDDCERLNEDAMLVAMLAFTELSELSTLEDELETASELVLTAKSAASMLDEEFEKLRLDP